MTSYFSLVLHEVAMHQVKISSAPGQKFSTVLTEELIDLSQEDRAFLANRFVRALAKNARPIREDPSLGSPIPGELRGFWADETSLLQKSTEMAEHLAAIQPLSSLPGLLVVARARVGNEFGVLVAKVEHQEAMRIEPTTNAAGHQVFQIERLRELVFGEGARVYKIAFFSKALSSTGSVNGDVADVQNGSEIATYFLSKFLGCVLREDPPVLTEQLLSGLTSAINKSGLQGEGRADAYTALVTELKSNVREFRARDFIQNHVPPAFQTEVSHLAESNGTPMVPFRKDLGLVHLALAKTRIVIDDVVIQAPPDQIGSGKQVEVGRDQTEDVVRIRGAINSIKSSGLA